MDVVYDDYFINLKKKIKDFLMKENEKYLFEKIVFLECIFSKLEENISLGVKYPNKVILDVKELENKMRVKNKDFSFFKDIINSIFDLSLDVDYPNGDFYHVRIISSHIIGEDNIYVTFSDAILEKKNDKGKIRRQKSIVINLQKCIWR